MATSSLTQTDLDKLEKALAKGALSVEIDGQRITYRSVDDLQKAIAYVRQQLAQNSSGGVVSASYASHSRD